MNDWHDIKQQLESWDRPSLLVTVLRADGSTPREAGTHMLVCDHHIAGTIGGGQLEQLAIERCRTLLQDTDGALQSEKISLPLGPELAQCCGGHVDLALYPIRAKDIFTSDKVLLKWANNEIDLSFISDVQVPSAELLKNDEFILQDYRKTDFSLALYGAGHVGKALVNILAPLPCHIHWIDTRPKEFPAATYTNVEQVICRDPAIASAEMNKGTLHLIMTHSHQQDYSIVRALLDNETKSYVGLIGSKTKWARFKKRLLRDGYSDQQINSITCPIGQAGLKGKHPAEIAISVAADILTRIAEQNHSANNDNLTLKLEEKTRGPILHKEVGKLKADAIKASKQG